jgi:transcriptional regulator with XRE-family HTH domain
VNTTNLGATLKAHRKAAGLSMRELSRRSDISTAYISSLEKGTRNPTIDTLDALFGAMGQRISIRVGTGIESVPEKPPLNLASRLSATIQASSPEALELFSQLLGAMALASPGEAQEMWRSLANETLTLSYERRTGHGS